MQDFFGKNGNDENKKQKTSELLSKKSSVSTDSSISKKQAPGKNEPQQVEKPFHPPKHFVFPKKKCGQRDRSCQHSWFETFDWLHYDERYEAHH